jgi:glycosyltransferase involved in cell wall biosynthesis
LPADRVLINARVARRATITGVERWTLELIPRLRALDPVRYIVAAPPSRASSRLPGQLWEQFLLPVWATHARAQIIFSPANLAPLAWPRNVVLVHDAAPFRRPEAYVRSYRWWHGVVGAACARRALRVVTVSEFSRRELVELLGLDPAMVTVIAGGVSGRFHPDRDPEPIRAKLGLHRPYVLTVGTSDERKNVSALGLAAQRLRADGFDVVQAGDARVHFSRAIPREGLRSVGYVDEQDLPGLYRGASAFVLPSVYEGLGLPCLEAMASGVPVVASNRAALPETCGDAAVLVEPEDDEALWRALRTVLEDQGLRQRLRKAGLRRAASFSWDRAAVQLDLLLASVAGGCRQPGIRPSP